MYVGVVNIMILNRDIQDIYKVVNLSEFIERDPIRHYALSLQHHSFL